MTKGGLISGRLRDFITDHFVTAEEVEILLMVWRGGDRWWRASDVAAGLHLTEAQVRHRLEQLSGRFLEVRVTADVRFRFAPNHPERQARVSELAAAYKEHRTDVIGLILAGRSARHFADAFRLKKQEGGE